MSDLRCRLGRHAWRKGWRHEAREQKGNATGELWATVITRYCPRCELREDVNETLQRLNIDTPFTITGGDQ